MNKYLKISLISVAVYIVTSILLAFFIPGFLAVFEGWDWCGGMESVSTCLQDVHVNMEVPFLIMWYVLLASLIVSAVAGLTAAYHAIKNESKWWHVITIFGSLNAVIVLFYLSILFTI